MLKQFYATRGWLKSRALRLWRPRPREKYVTAAPHPQNALDIFEGEWTSRLPDPWRDLRAGAMPLFDDRRLRWGIDELGGIEDQRVLELGPLEAGHTWMLHQLGAARITAVESNTRAYLKCLVMKELLGLERARFLCGDFVAYLRNERPRVAVCIASGVLYHMQAPAELLALIAAAADRAYLWTHYYDAAAVARHPKVASRFSGTRIVEHEGFTHTLHRQTYGSAAYAARFCGGLATSSHWMTREDILAALRYFGFSRIRTGFDEPDHPNGPCFALVATREPHGPAEAGRHI